MIATCTHCGTSWDLNAEDVCPGCGACSYTVPRHEVDDYQLQREWFKQAEEAGSWDV